MFVWVLLSGLGDNGGQRGTRDSAESVFLQINLQTNSSSAVHSEKPFHRPAGSYFNHCGLSMFCNIVDHGDL